MTENCCNRFIMVLNFSFFFFSYFTFTLIYNNLRLGVQLGLIFSLLPPGCRAIFVFVLSFHFLNDSFFFTHSLAFSSKSSVKRFLFRVFLLQFSREERGEGGGRGKEKENTPRMKEKKSFKNNQVNDQQVKFTPS